jgi:hypothetical protein
MNLLHNMSSPPRSSVTLGGQAVAKRTGVVCFVWALAQKVVAAASLEPNHAAKGGARVRRGRARWDWRRHGIPGIGCDVPDSLQELAKRIRVAHADPADLFRKIGQPVAPAWHVDFLIGYRLRYEDMKIADAGSQVRLLDPVLCTDPLLCAGILSRCAGDLFLSRRAPSLSWEALLGVPIAFDDSLAIFP